MTDDRVEGYWANQWHPEYPMPVAVEPWDGQQEFLAKLVSVEEAITKKNFGTILYMKGWSECRCCGKMNGSQEFKFNGWRWPEGFIHYIRDHNVRPTDDFYTMIMGQQL